MNKIGKINICELELIVSLDETTGDSYAKYDKNPAIVIGVKNSDNLTIKAGFLHEVVESILFLLEFRYDNIGQREKFFYQMSHHEFTIFSNQLFRIIQGKEYNDILNKLDDYFDKEAINDK